MASKYQQMIAHALKYGAPRDKPKEAEKPSAEVIPLPQGSALAVAKEDRTSAEEISEAMRALEEKRLKHEEWKRQQRERRDAERAEKEAELMAQRHAEWMQHQADYVMNGPQAQAAAARLNREYFGGGGDGYGPNNFHGRRDY